jgi:hypothetical protein
MFLTSVADQLDVAQLQFMELNALLVHPVALHHLIDAMTITMDALNGILT